MTLSATQRLALTAACDPDPSLHAHARAVSSGGSGFGWKGWSWGAAELDLDGRACRGLLVRGLIRQGPWLADGVALFVATELGRKMEVASVD